MTHPDGALVVYTIYDHPTDYPDSFVARTWIVNGNSPPQATGEAFAAGDLGLVRKWIQQIAPGVVCLHRSEEDDPAILETWL